jgi:hypothetical protein
VWIDVYDYVPAFGEAPGTELLTPAVVDELSEHGVHTLYLQVAKDDPRSPGLVTDPRAAAAFLERAHAAGIRVVAWYLPTHRDPQLDLDRMRALIDFRAGTERFDGVALDIEGIDAVSNVAERNRRLVELANATASMADEAGDLPVGAIVYPPVVFDVLNTTLWPDFPWRALAPSFDVWMPMAYWTFRDAGDQLRDAQHYTDDNIARVRAHLGDDQLPIHPIGGIADTSTDADYAGFTRAAIEQRSIGASVYDLNTTEPSAWPLLSAVPTPDC